MQKIEIGSGNMNKLFKDYQIEILTKNGLIADATHNCVPCVYLLGNTSKWLISEIDFTNPNLAYGLYSIEDKVAIGNIELDKLLELHENKEYFLNDESFDTLRPLSVFHEVSKELGGITIDEELFIDLFEKYSV